MSELILQEGCMESLTANTIVHNLIAEFDIEAKRRLLLEEIIDHWKDETSFLEEEAFVTIAPGARRQGSPQMKGRCKKFGDTKLREGSPIEDWRSTQNIKLIMSQTIIWWHTVESK